MRETDRKVASINLNSALTFKYRINKISKKAIEKLNVLPNIPSYMLVKKGTQ